MTERLEQCPSLGIYLATPARDVEPCYVDALNATLRHLRALGVRSRGPDMQGGSWTAAARNESCHAFLEDENCTHLLFLDSDLWWYPEEVSRLLAHALDVEDRGDPRSIIGAHYPKKELQWWRVEELSEEERADPNVVCEAVSRGEWPHRVLGEPVEVANAGSRVEVDHVPTGFLLLSRAALTTFRARYEERSGVGALSYFPPDSLTPRTEFFTYMVDGKRVLRGEDTLFCTVARGLGLKVWKLLDTKIRHVGKVMF